MAPPAYSALITLLTTSALIHFTAAQPPPAKASSPSLPSPPAPGCVGELVLFSPCLSFVSSPPNNRSKTAPSKCCDAFIAAINSGDGPCLCLRYVFPTSPLGEAICRRFAPVLLKHGHHSRMEQYQGFQTLLTLVLIISQHPLRACHQILITREHHQVFHQTPRTRVQRRTHQRNSTRDNKHHQRRPVQWLLISSPAASILRLKRTCCRWFFFSSSFAYSVMLSMYQHTTIF